MKERISQIGLKFLLVFYTIFSILSLSNCKKSEDENSSLDLIKINKIESIQFLSTKYNAIPFDCSIIEDLVNKSVVLDTTVIGIVKRGNENYIKAQIKSDCKSKYFAELSCSEKIIQEFGLTKSNSILLVAEIKSIIKQDYAVKADSLYGKETHLGTEQVSLLLGNCLAILENERTANAN